MTGDDLLLVIVLLGFIPTLLFVVDYHRHAEWWRTPYGQTLMSLAAVIGLVYLNGIGNLLADWWPDWTGPVLWALGAVAMWQRYLVYRLGRQDRDGAADPEHPKRRRTDLT